MIHQALLALGLAIATCGKSVVAVDRVKDPELVAKLSTASTQLQRLSLLPEDKDWVFDFKAQTPFYNFSPGGVTNMNSATFPTGTRNGLTLAMVNLGPCSMLPPHYHPRAANWVVNILGTTTTYMFEENGAHIVKTVLGQGEATIFPQGSIHTMVNNECENAQLVSALDNEDAGTTNIGNIFTGGFPMDLLSAAFGFNVTDEMSAHVPPIGTGANAGTPECLAKCGISSENSTYPDDTKPRLP